MPLSQQGEDLLRELVRRIEAGGIIAGRPATYPGYGQVHDSLGLEMHGETVGQSLKHQGLASLAEWTHENAHPAITGMIVRQDDFMPGDGYFELFGHTNMAFEWWENEIARSLVYEWAQFLGQPPREPPFTPEAADLEAPPKRVPTTEYRILRDTELARRIKRLHDYRCQICGHTIELPDGTFYAEGHHIKPLGKPHNGPDREGNILCLCPNHHAAVDLGAIEIEISILRHVDSHSVGPEYIDYHNEHIFG